ncbi:MAG: hypothetical protein C0610_06580 [Desulfobacteraceae bacterium]|nr:MAG: hypothetical protein C0610_06580 [Desulfobacteraceae bacterium]
MNSPGLCPGQAGQAGSGRGKPLPQVNLFLMSSFLYLLQQMTAKRSDLMTPKAHDAKLDES